MEKIWETLAKGISLRQQAILAVTIEGPQAGQTALYSPAGQLLAGQSLLTAAECLETGLIEKDNALLYRERIVPPPSLIIFGGGHIAVPLAIIGKLTGFSVAVIDDRSDFANSNRFPDADTVLAMDYKAAADKLKLGNGDYVVIVTRGHVHDRQCLALTLETHATYIGMIGSKKKVLEVYVWAQEQGFSEQDLSRVFAPVGIKINAQTPEEIAVSIIAEVIQERSKQPPTADLSEILEALKGKGKTTWALATIVQAGGSTPRGAGSRMLIKPDGSIVGTVGGGLGEKLVQEAAMGIIKTGHPRLLDYNLNNTLAAGEGMICGGQFKIFVQPV